MNGTFALNTARQIPTFAIYSVGTIGLSKRGHRKPSNLLGAARHNLRKIAAELGPSSCIDIERSRFNVILTGPDSPEAIVNLAKEKILQTDNDIKKLRYDYVQSVEILISLTRELNGGSIPFFQACVQWLENWFGETKILSAVIHLDENYPHVHVLISPVVGGKVNGSLLISRKNLLAQRTAFGVEVAAHFGVQLPCARLSKSDQRKAALKVLQHLESSLSPLLSDQAWPSIKQAITKDPQPFAADYGIKVEFEEPKPTMRTSTQIFTSKGRGSQYRS
uniref:plasmid recombination protein n=1 Tax=Limnohabitans sp. TaxID=1907725 RepID=UPI00404726EC